LAVFGLLLLSLFFLLVLVRRMHLLLLVWIVAWCGKSRRKRNGTRERDAKRVGEYERNKLYKCASALCVRGIA